MKENLQNVENSRNILNGFIGPYRGQNIQLVTEEYFHSLTLKVNNENIHDAVLGFCSLVLSYAKAANKKDDPTDAQTQERSPKSWIPFMPRTELVTIYGAVKSFFPADDELFDIFNVLACYKTVLPERHPSDADPWNKDLVVRYVGSVALNLDKLANSAQHRQRLLYWDAREPYTR